MLDTAIREKHPAKLGIDCLDQTLENTLLKAFNADIIHLNDFRKKNIENLKAGYYLNLEVSLLMHYAIDSLMEDKHTRAFKTISYVFGINQSNPFLEKVLQKKRDHLYKFLQIYTCYLISKSNLDIINGDIEEGLTKVTMTSVLILNYIQHSSSLYDNIVKLYHYILTFISSTLGEDYTKKYTHIINSIEKKTITQNHIISGKLSKEIKKSIEEIKHIELYKWMNEDEDEDTIYSLYTKSTSSFRATYQPWYGVWRILMKKWDGKSQKKINKKLDKVIDVEVDHLEIDIRTLNA